MEKPFFFAIETAGGDWHDGEYCVFSDRREAQDQVDTLNEDLPKTEWFRVVPLYRGGLRHRGSSPNSAKASERWRSVERWLKRKTFVKREVAKNFKKQCVARYDIGKVSFRCELAKDHVGKHWNTFVAWSKRGRESR